MKTNYRRLDLLKNTIARRVLGITAVLAATAALGSASTLTYYYDVFGNAGTATLTPLTTATATYANPGATTTFSIPKLNALSDPNPGMHYVMQSVTVALNWVAQGDVQVFSIAPSTVTFSNATTTVPLTLTAGSTTVAPVAQVGPTGGAATCCIALTSVPGLTGSGTATNPGNPNEFIGNGATSLTASVTLGSANSGGTGVAGQTFFGGTATAGAIAVITYNFTETSVPEPASFALMGGALLAIGAGMRKIRSQKA